MAAPDWKYKANQIALIRKACLEGEAMLAAQVQIATSADQRATVLAGIYVAAATGVIGAYLTKTNTGGGIPLGAAAVGAALTFLIGAFLCLRATLPVLFWTPGSEPHCWYKDIDDGVAEHIALGQQLEIYDKHIEKNEATLKRNARFFRWGAGLGICAPIIGLILAGVSCLVLSNLGKP